MKTQEQRAQVLDLGKLTKEFLQAHVNALKLESTSIRLAAAGFKKLKKKKDKTSRKIKFGNVTIVDSREKSQHTTTINWFTESRKEGTVRSGLFLETYILQLLIYIDPQKWETCKLPCHTQQDLLVHLAAENIPFDVFCTDLRKIYNDFLKFKSSILGYKDSWTFGSVQKKLVARRDFFSDTFVWQDEGHRVNILPKIKLDLLKIVKDVNLAASIIQKNWHRKKAQNNLKAQELMKIQILLFAFAQSQKGSAKN